MPRSYFSELGSEIRKLVGAWWIGVVVVSTALGLASAFITPPKDATTAQVVGATFGGILTGLLGAFLLVLLIALVRVSAREHRRRYRLAKLGEECLDLTEEILNLVPFWTVRRAEEDEKVEAISEETIAKSKKKAEQMTDQEKTTMHSTYERRLASRVFRVAESLRRAEIISLEERDKLVAQHHSLQELLNTANTLSTYGMRLRD